MNKLLMKAHESGFMLGAAWANRDDLKSDIDSTAYAIDRARDLASYNETINQDIESFTCSYNNLDKFLRFELDDSDYQKYSSDLKLVSAVDKNFKEPAFIELMIKSRRRRLELDQTCTPEFFHWLDTQTDKQGVGANEAWNAGHACATAAIKNKTMVVNGCTVCGYSYSQHTKDDKCPTK